MRNNSLQLKIITFLMIAVPIIIISYVFIWENASQRKTAEIDKNFTITTAFAQLIEQNVEDKRDSMVNLARMLSISETEYSALHEILKSLKTYADENYYIIDLDGDILVSSNYSWDELQRLNDSQYFNQALQGETVITPLERSPFSGENVWG